MAVYGYARVSTARQAGEGESLDVQQRTISGYAMMHGLTVDRMFVERGVSGSKPLADRPEGAALLAALGRGDTVITAKLDRMFRSALDALDALDVLRRLQGRDVGLHMIDLGGDVTGTGISKLVFTILSAVAEAERDRIRERVAVVKADQRARAAAISAASSRSATRSRPTALWRRKRTSRRRSPACGRCAWPAGACLQSSRLKRSSSMQ